MQLRPGSSLYILQRIQNREDDMFRIAEGFGLGMGVMEMCGALSGMAMIIGLDNSQGGTEEIPEPKGIHIRNSRRQSRKIQREKWFLHLPELKGVETGKVLCSCPQCIADAVVLTEEYLAEQGKINVWIKIKRKMKSGKSRSVDGRKRNAIKKYINCCKDIEHRNNSIMTCSD